MSDTQSHSVVPGGRPRWWVITVLVPAFAVIAAVIGAGLLPASLVSSKESTGECAARGEESAPYARVPAGTHDVAQRVNVEAVPEDVEVYAPGNSVRFVTIAEPAQTMLSRLVAPDEPYVMWMTDCEKYGDATPQQRREVSLEMMATSEDVAKYVAFQSLGYDAEVIPLGVEVRRFLCLGEVRGGECSDPPPAQGQLEQNDVIRTAAGQDVNSMADLTAALEEAEPGDAVELGIERGDETLTETVELVEHPENPDRVLIGFEAYEPFDVELPFDVPIDTGEIGGPSAGLAFTLTLIDELSPGELTGDLEITVTGTIDALGRVGPIGGLPQKVETARAAGADVFLIPATQSDQDLSDAREIAGDDLEVVPVATLEDAIDALEEQGGDPVDLEPLDAELE